MPTLQIKRGTAAAVAAVTLKAGELALITSSNTLQIGDGTTKGGKPLRTSKRSFEYASVVTEGTSFTLSRSYFDCDVYVEGIIQIPDYSYTLTGNTLVMASPLAVGNLLYVVGWV